MSGTSGGYTLNTAPREPASRYTSFSVVFFPVRAFFFVSRPRHGLRVAARLPGGFGKQRCAPRMTPRPGPCSRRPRGQATRPPRAGILRREVLTELPLPLEAFNRHLETGDGTQHPVHELWALVEVPRRRVEPRHRVVEDRAKFRPADEPRAAANVHDRVVPRGNAGLRVAGTRTARRTRAARERLRGPPSRVRGLSPAGSPAPVDRGEGAARR